MNQATMLAETFDPLALMTRLQEEHKELELRLSGLTRATHLTPAEEVEVRRLKRMKLAKKDQMQLLSSRLHRS